MNRLESFDIRNLNLNILKEESTQLVCECPACGGHRLTVDKKTGAYQCWSGGCECAKIREALAPWAERQQEKTTTSSQPRPSRSRPRKQVRSAPLPEQITLAKLALPVESPQSVKRFDPKHGEVEETLYHYTEDKWKTRVQWSEATKSKGYEKTFVLYHRDSSGKVVAKAGVGTREPYRISEAIASATDTGANAIKGCEGEKGAEIHRTQLGLACITLSSFSNAELELMAQLLKAAGLTLVYSCDNDQAGRTKGDKVKAACDAAGVPCIVIDPVRLCPNLTESGDVAEVLQIMDVAEFVKRLEQEIHAAVEARRGEQLKLEQSSSGGSGGSGDQPGVVKDIETRFAKRLRLNRLSGQVELDGQPLRVEEFYLTLRRSLGLKINKQLTIDLVMQLARENEYSPVVEYLEEVSRQYGDTTTALVEDMACRYFGTSDPLYNTYVKRMLIGAVARALDPGCKLDDALVLQGQQGYFKSTFFNVLAGKWFDDSLGDAGNKDERLKLRSSWFLEWSELERAFSKRSTSDIKAFMSCRVDNLRVPYGRTIEAFPRHCVLVGTSNEEEFLADATGDRRFWVVPIQKQIDCKLLKEERDRLWAAAVELYHKGEQWWLTKDELTRSRELNQPFRVEDPWLLHIKDYVGRSSNSGGILRVYTKNILENCLGLDKGKQERATQMRVAAVLKRLGFTKKPDSKGNSSWVQMVEEVSVPSNNAASILPATQSDTQLIPTDTSNLKVSVASNDLAARVSDTQLIPTDTITLSSTKSSDVVAVEQVAQLIINSGSVPGVEVSEVSVGIRNEDTAKVSNTDTCTDTCTDTSTISLEKAEIITNLTLAPGDSLADSSGSVMQVAKLAAGGWLLSNGGHVSRADLKAGIYTKVEPTTPELTQVRENAQLLIDYSELITDKQTLLDITGQWEEAHKVEVWKLLPHELQQQLRAL